MAGSLRDASAGPPLQKPRRRRKARLVSTGALVLVCSHLVATVAMVGIIWFVQVVHYPLFSQVGEHHFVAYELTNTRLTSFVVGPPMAVEGVSVLVLLAAPPRGVGLWLPLVGAALLAVVHASTVFLQVPAHSLLSRAADPAAMRRLVRTNWIRTIGWSARGVVAVAVLVAAIR